MNFFKNIFHYAPIFSIIILVIMSVHFFWFYVPNAGKGSDAAGMGMAGGYAAIISCIILSFYALVLSLSLVLFFKNTQAQVLRIILNCILLSPVLIWVLLFLSRIRDQSAQSVRLEKSYQNWKAIAETQAYNSLSGKFSFQYSSYCKGTFNLSYIEKINIKELKDSIILFIQNSNDPDSIFILGSIKVLTISPENTEIVQYITNYFKNFVNKKCSFIKTDNHPFNLLLNENLISVYTFDSEIYRDCIFDYIQYLEEKDRYFARKIYANHNDMYFIYNKKRPDIILEIVISNKLAIAGPVEQNLSHKNIVDWYQTISFK